MATGVDPEVIALLEERLGDRSTPADQDKLRAFAKFDPERAKRYTTARNYYEGEQRTLLTDRAKAYLERSGLPYAENFCATVVDALAERLSVAGVTTDLAYEPAPDEKAAGEEGEDEYADWLWDCWDANRGDELQTDIHHETTETGDGFVLVDWDAARERARLTFNRAELITPVYEDREMTCAVKVWDSVRKSPVNPNGRAVRRMTIYWPDRVDKWFCPAKQGADKAAKDEWVEWLDEGDKGWPVPWVGADGKPLGVPVFHFANLRTIDGLGRPEHYQSIPQQDRLNKELLDLAAVMDSLGFPQRWAQGVSDTSGLTADPGVVWSSDNPGAVFGQFAAADPGGLLKACESTLIRMATRSRTPAHLIYLAQGLPSGEALKTAESGLVAKVKNRQVYYGGVWAESLRMASLVALTFAADKDKPPCDIEEAREAKINVRWADPETRNEKEHLDSLVVMQTLGVSDDTLLSMIPGVDAAEERDKKELEANSNAAAGEGMLSGAINPAEMMPEDMMAGLRKPVPVEAGG